ncbi:DUF1972 domain-containing protein [Flavobacteriaceae bacterium Ap0902]|nr:DUF1972 domain-containing protein [Flavobacteriaceae bacterium Ap0902]
MRLGIIGTRGVPNHHGGFEQFAEFFSVYAAEHGWDVSVYNSSLHPYQEDNFKGVHIIHVHDLEDKIGTPGQFIYDYHAIMDARKRNFDVILQLGYTSNSVWGKLLPKSAVIVTNMDGLEWKRTKYNKYVKKFLKYAERWAVNTSDYLIADSIGIQEYLQKTYQVKSEYIAYGAEPISKSDDKVLDRYGLNPYEYNMLIARIEPENNIETILDGYAMSDKKFPFLVIGAADKTSFGQHLLDKYKEEKRIQFLGAIYDQRVLNNLRYYAHLYFHGHSVGGTNPSLLEAMATKACIVANDNLFNQSILKENAYYFYTSEDIREILNTKDRNIDFIKANYHNIIHEFKWDRINQQYFNFLKECLDAGKTIK